MSRVQTLLLSGGAIGGNDSFTKMLLHCDGTNGGTTFTDSSSIGRTITPTNCTTSTSPLKYGTASAAFNGTSSLLSTASSADLQPAGDYTIDLWVNPAVVTGTARLIIGKETAGTGLCPYVIYQNATSFVFSASSNNVSNDIANAVSIGTASTSTWSHLAVVRTGNTYYAFQNGSQTATFSSSLTPWADGLSALILGRFLAAGPQYFSGNLDEVRFSNGIARWTSGFTPVGPYT